MIWNRYKDAEGKGIHTKLGAVDATGGVVLT